MSISGFSKLRPEEECNEMVAEQNLGDVTMPYGSSPLPDRGRIESKLTPHANLILTDLLSHHQLTSVIGRARLFKLYDDRYDYARELGMTSEEVQTGIDELYQLGIAYSYPPSKATHGKWKFALYKEFTQKLSFPSTTAATTDADSQNRQPTNGEMGGVRDGGKSSNVPSFDQVHGGVSPPVPHLLGNQASGTYIPGIVYELPAKVHRLCFSYKGRLSPALAHFLYETAQKGKPPNNKTGTLTYCTYQIGYHGGGFRVYLDAENPSKGLEELAEYCNRHGHILNLEMESRIRAEYAFKIHVLKAPEYLRDRPWAVVRIRSTATGSEVQFKHFFDVSIPEGHGEVEVSWGGKNPEEGRRMAMAVTVPDFMVAWMSDLTKQITEIKQILVAKGPQPKSPTDVLRGNDSVVQDSKLGQQEG